MARLALRHVTDDWRGWFLTFITHDFRQYCHVGKPAQHCRLGLFQDSDFARDLEDSKSTSGGVLYFIGSRTFVLVSWMCKKQTAVSHSSTESDIISLQQCPTQTHKHSGKWFNSSFQKTRPRKSKEDRRLINWVMWIMCPPTHILLIMSLSCTYLKTTKPWSKWELKDEVRRWDTCQEPTELRLIGCSTEPILNPRSKSNMLTPKTNLLTF